MDTQFANKFRFLVIDISNGNPHTKLTGTFYDNRGSEISDEFIIEKEIKNKNSEVILEKELINENGLNKGSSQTCRTNLFITTKAYYNKNY